jgi:hypothetical protein
MHHERRLHAHPRAIAGIDALDLACDEAVGDVVHAGAAVALDRRAEEAERAHLVEDLAVELLVAECLAHARLQLFLAIVARAVAHHAFLFGELVLEEKGVVPLEGGSHVVRLHDGCVASICAAGRFYGMLPP